MIRTSQIPSLATPFPSLEPAHGNDQAKDANSERHNREEQNVTFSPLQGAAAATMEQIHRCTTENHKNGRKDIDGGITVRPEEVDGKGIAALSENDALLLRDGRDGVGGAEGVPIKSIAGGNAILDIVDAPIGSEDSPLVPPARGIESLANEQGSVTATRSHGRVDILKSIVCGGLVEAITSLGVVSSAAGAGATTLNVVALGTASLVSGLLVTFHALGGQVEKVDRHEEPRRAIVVVLSYLVFGLLPPITYGFSFRSSNNKDCKFLSAAAVSLICITLLAIGKAHTRRPPRSNSSYIKTTLYFLSIGLAASGLSFVLGVVVKKLLEKFAVLEPNAAGFSPPPPSSSFLLGQTIPSMAAELSAWRASY